MALGMSDAEIAISTKGMNELKSTINTLTTKAKNTAKADGDEFKKLENTLRKYWVGEDCDNFIKDLRTAAKQLETAIGQYSTLLTKGLSNYETAFKKMQRENYQGNKISIKI